MREPAGYREQLEHLAQRYPDQEVLGLQEVCEMLKCGRRKLLADKNFPVKQVGGKGKYYVPITALARWLVS